MAPASEPLPPTSGPAADPCGVLSADEQARSSQRPARPRSRRRTLRRRPSSRAWRSSRTSSTGRHDTERAPTRRPLSFGRSSTKMLRMEIYSIGFTQTSAEHFFGRLSDAGVAGVLDVRLNNSSQLAGFAKARDLPFFLRELIGAEYRHEPRLAPTRSLFDDFKKKKGELDAVRRALHGTHDRAPDRNRALAARLRDVYGLAVQRSNRRAMSPATRVRLPRTTGPTCTLSISASPASRATEAVRASGSTRPFGSVALTGEREQTACKSVGSHRSCKPEALRPVGRGPSPKILRTPAELGEPRAREPEQALPGRTDRIVAVVDPADPAAAPEENPLTVGSERNRRNARSPCDPVGRQGARRSTRPTRAPFRRCFR